MATLEASSPSSSSSSSPQSGKYDVFLSFRGTDTRLTFTDHLHQRLSHNFNVFLDDEELRKGESTITEELKQAIENSKMAVIVFSKGYADSRWCLEELVKIMECRRLKKQKVFPIFYTIRPTDVRKQTGSFAQAFGKHERCFHEETTKRWRDALAQVADLPGLDLATTDGHEGKFITCIINHITIKLKTTRLPVASNPVGIESRLQGIISDYLDVGGSNDVRIIGILGMGGHGKTTIAKAIWNKFEDKFRAKSFLGDVSQKNLVDLQTQLLCDILESTNTKEKVSDVAAGQAQIESRLGNLEVLVVVDDIDCEKQLEALAINRERFGGGSRIVITTRDAKLLKKLKVDKVYLVQRMNEEEALQLLSWRAFNKKSPDSHYLEVSRQVVDYCGGLPLALKVLGEQLCTKSTKGWEMHLQKWKEEPHADIRRNFERSYDGLTGNQVRDLFLDISCFFIGMKRKYVMTILDIYNSNQITELDERCLVTDDKEGNLMMHPLIRDMGRYIVFAESKFPEERSRLWHQEDVLGVLSESGEKKIEGITLDLLESQEERISTEAFRKMKNLRLLKLKGVKVMGEYEHFSKKLTWVCWHRSPINVIPEEFYHSNLVDIDLSDSNIKTWNSPRILKKLKFLNLSCNCLTQSSDFSKLPNLERLILRNCGLSEIPDSIRQLKNLEYLSLRGNSFNWLPILSSLSKLQTLNLDECRNLQEIKKLPTNLEILKADECTALENMPDFSEMSTIRELHLNHSPNLTEIVGLDKTVNSMTTIHMEGCTNLTMKFKKTIKQGWRASVNGSLFLPGNDVPSVENSHGFGNDVQSRLWNQVSATG